MQWKANSLPWQNYLESMYPCACADGSSLACSLDDDCFRLDTLFPGGRSSRRHFLTTEIIGEGQAQNTGRLTNQAVRHGPCRSLVLCGSSWALLATSAS